MEQRVQGVVIGIVSKLDDPEKLGRVKLKYPDLGDVESDWAYLAAPMAGKEMGLFLRPEVGDQVLVAFVRGDRRQPYVIGAIWSAPQPPPPQEGEAKENNWRFLRSRSGHQLIFDDKKGSERVIIRDKPDGPGQFREVVIDSANKKIQITCNPNGDIEIKAPKGRVSIEAKTIELKATGDIKIEAGANVKIKGVRVDIN